METRSRKRNDGIENSGQLTSPDYTPTSPHYAPTSPEYVPTQYNPSNQTPPPLDDDSDGYGKPVNDGKYVNDGKSVNGDGYGRSVNEGKYVNDEESQNQFQAQQDYYDSVPRRQSSSSSHQYFQKQHHPQHHHHHQYYQKPYSRPYPKHHHHQQPYSKPYNKRPKGERFLTADMGAFILSQIPVENWYKLGMHPPIKFEDTQQYFNDYMTNLNKK